VSPGSSVPTQAEEQRFEQIHIDDFTPGCFDNSFISLADPKLSAPLGSADAIATWCCAALAAGDGLGPLPALTTIAGDTPALPGTSTSAFITGFIVNPGLDSAVDELVIIFEADDGTDHYLRAYSDVPNGPSLNSILSVTAATQVGIFGSPYPAWTRMNVAGSGTPPPPPTLVFPAALDHDARGPDGHLYIYPEILAPTSFAVQDLITGTAAGNDNSSVTGQVVCYGSRVICLVGINYPWPAGGGINTNEILNYTDPPQSSTYGNQEDVLAAEDPWGYGAWGTMSVGELMLIKKNGGGLIVYGDIDSVSSVIPMPGVQSVGDFVGKAASTPAGLVYCSEQRGAWIWNGGNTAQKISAQLRDSFYDATTVTGMEGNNYGFDVAHWQDWILFSNNYLYDMDKGAWWQLYPGDGNNGTDTTGVTFWWWNESRFGNQMWAAPLRFGTATGLKDKWWYKFDSEVPAPHWQWQSLPIHVDANADRVLDVRQVIVRLSDPSASGNATATVTVNGTDIGTVPNPDEGPSTIGQDPTQFRLNCGVRGIGDIVIKIQGDNAVSGSSPILHSIDVGYEVRAGVHVSN
jgi:hypothetical protein